MATETGPMLATASFRAASSACGSSTYLEQVAARVEALYRHVPFWWEQGGVEKRSMKNSPGTSQDFQVRVFYQPSFTLCYPVLHFL